jgi:hypothetical protein
METHHSPQFLAISFHKEYTEGSEKYEKQHFTSVFQGFVEATRAAPPQVK